MRPSAHGTWLGRNAVCLYLYMCIIIPSSFQALPGWTIVTCSHLNAWSSSTKTVTKWRNSEAQSQKKGVSDRVGFLSNAKILFHMTFSILFYELSKRFFSQFFPFVCCCRSKVRVEDSYYARTSMQEPQSCCFGRQEKSNLERSAHLHSNDCQGHPV